LNTILSFPFPSLVFFAETGNSWWNIVPNVTDRWKLAAFGIAAILTIVLKVRRRSVPTIVWIVILLLVIIPISVSVYQSVTQSKNDAQAIYRVRVNVIDPQRVPVEGARVWSSVGGETKTVAGGAQFDIPAATIPLDGKVTIFATQSNASLTGEHNLVLSRDHNPSIIIQLKLDNSAKVRGQVVDKVGKAIAGARVWVVGYGNEGITTQVDGNFELPAHTAIKQPVELHAEKKGYKPANQFHPAGDEAVTLVLPR
jgi:hypothetical protein